MSNPEEIIRLSTRFASDKTEAAYQAFVFSRNLRSNAWGVAVGIVFIAIYTFAEFIDSPDPYGGAAVRGVLVLLSTVLLLSLFNKRIARHHDAITAVILILMGVATNYNIWRQPSLDNTFYIGLIQGYIIFALLLRLSFTSIVLVFTVTQASFAAVVFSKADIENAILQSANTLVVCVICIAGVYLLQRYQRTDFLKSQTIEKQNARLKVLLAEAERDNERKLAALNTLIHFVKTPIHQIVGFTDLIVNALREMPGKTAAAQIEHADFVKKASADLASNVSKLLSYYQLDERIKGVSPEPLALSSMLEDFKDMLDPDIACVIESAPRRVSNFAEPVRVALECMARWCSSENGVTKVSVKALEGPDAIAIEFTTDGPEIGEARFSDLTTPLTHIQNYLTTEGLAMPMALRTVAHAAEICGGGLAYSRGPDGNVLTFSIADAAEANRPTREEMRAAAA